MKNRISAAFVVGLVLLSVLACSDLRKKTAVRSETPDFEITADDLATAYKTDAKAADDKYGGRTLAITGVVDDKVLGGSIVFAGSRKYGFATQCFFEKKDGSVNQIKNGSTVTMIGICKGQERKDDPLVISQCVLR